MQAPAVGGALNIGAQYVRSFQALGVNDRPKVQALARLLEGFYEVAGPQHRWIRVIDRLEVFGDSDDHASRLVNVGLSYDYRHEDLDVLKSSNAVHPKDSCASAEDRPHPGNSAAPLQQPPTGGVVVARRPGPSGSVGGVPGPGGEGAACEGGAQLAFSPGTADDGAGVAVPPGGLVISTRGSGPGPRDNKREREAATVQQAGGAPGGVSQASTDVRVQDGGVIVGNRPLGASHRWRAIWSFRVRRSPGGLLHYGTQCHRAG